MYGYQCIALGPMTSKVHKIWQNLMERSRLLYPCLFYRDLQVWTRGIVRPNQTVHALGCMLKNSGTQLELDIVKVKLFSFHKVCVCKFNGDFLILQLLFTIKSLRILISNSLSSGNSKHNDSITMIFWLATFLFIFMRIILMHRSIKSWIISFLNRQDGADVASQMHWSAVGLPTGGQC